MYKHGFKRLLDILFSFVGIVVLAIPLVIFALIIKARSIGGES